MALTLRNQVDALMQRANFEPLSEMQLADMLGFTEREKQLLALFWDLAFNDNLIYLSDYLILNHFTTERGKNAVTHFIVRKLKIDEFKEGTDYFGLDKNDPLIQAYHVKLAIENSTLESKSEDSDESPILVNHLDSSKAVRKQYFAVTAICFKKLLMNSDRKLGAETRDYYIKIESMAKLMLTYNNSLQERKLIKQVEENKKLVEEAKATKLARIKARKLAVEKAAKAKSQKEADDREIARLKLETLVKDLNHQYRDKRDQLQPNGWIYIVASKNTFKTNMFKVGKTNDLDARLAQYHTGHHGDDRMEYLYFAEVPSADLYEPIVFHMLQQWRVKSKSPGAKNKSDAEVVNMPFKSLKHIVNLTISGNWREAMDYVNCCISTDILIIEAIAYKSAVENNDFSTHIVIFTPSRITHDLEELCLQNLPSFASATDRDLPANKTKLRELAEAYVNSHRKSAQVQCSNAPFASSTTKKYAVPVVKFREYINLKKLAVLPASKDDFKAYMVDVIKDHPQIKICTKTPVNWKI